MKRVKYEIQEIRVFKDETTFKPSVNPWINGGEEDLDGDTYSASGADTSTPQP